MCLCSKQSSLFSFYALPSGGKLKDVVVHYGIILQEHLSTRISKIAQSGHTAHYLSPSRVSCKKSEEHAFGLSV